MNTHRSMEQWHIPEHIHPLFHDGGVVYMDSRNGIWQGGNRAVGAVMLYSSGLLDSIRPDWPEVEDETLKNTTASIRVANAGLLAAGADPRPERTYHYAQPPEDIELLDAGNVTMTVRRPVHKQYSPDLEEIALNAARQALELVHAAIDDSKAFSALVDTVRRSRPTELADPTVDEAREIVGITYEANYDLPDKFACLERAVAASLTGARLGLAIYTQFGVAVDPVTFHTWSAVGEELTPIRLEDDIPIEGRFYPVYTL